MNSKIFLLSMIIFSFGCGVKAKPLSPPDTAIPSYVNSFLEQKPQTPSPQK